MTATGVVRAIKPTDSTGEGNLEIPSLGSAMNSMITRITVGLHWNFPNFKIHYTGQLTLGTGRPGIGGVTTNDSKVSAMSGDFLIAPSGSLALDGAILLTHQVSVIFPIRD